MQRVRYSLPDFFKRKFERAAEFQQNSSHLLKTRYAVLRFLHGGRRDRRAFLQPENSPKTGGAGKAYGRSASQVIHILLWIPNVITVYKNVPPYPVPAESSPHPLHHDLFTRL